MKKFFLFALLGACFTQWSDAQTYQWASQMGGVSDDISKSIVVDAAGNVYSTGYFYDTVDFDPGPGVFNLITTATYSDIYISKLDASGNFVWAKQVECTSLDWGLGITLDASGNVYTTGRFSGAADFDPGVGTFNLSTTSPGEIFILKLTSSGDFVWVKEMAAIGLSGNASAGVSIHLDASDNIYTSGYFVDTVDFDPGAGVYPLNSKGSKDIFVSKLNSSGDFVWAKQMGGTGSDEVYALAVDDLGNAYTTGGFNDTVDFDPGAGTFTLISSGTEVFVSKLDASGIFVWAGKFGDGFGDYYGQGITVDADENVYTTGYVNGSTDFDPGVVTYYAGSGVGETFVSKLNAAGNFVWAKILGGTSFDYGNSITLDADGNVLLTGAFIGTGDFDPGAGIVELTSNGNFDIFVSRLDTAGKYLDVWQMGGTSTDRGEAIFADASGSIYTTGSFQTTVDFDPGAGTDSLSSLGFSDIFVHKWGFPGVGINEAYFSKLHSIFPNPTSSSLTIQSDENIKSISIYNSAGVCVQTECHDSFSVENLPAGLYLLEISTDKGISRGRFIKE